VENADNEIDSNQCCTCFGLFSVRTEREWLKCHCGRWIHEECVDEDDITVVLQSYVLFVCNFLAFIQYLNFISL